jgi:holo-[acyl-carrier protein] synthase
MIIGTGIDIIEVERVAIKIGKDNGFTEKVFSEAEIMFCESKKNKGEHYAARFAAKEAFLKATGLGLLASYDLHLIEVLPDANGKPEIILKGDLATLAKQHHWKKIHVSLSHLSTMACATVIIEG